MEKILTQFNCSDVIEEIYKEEIDSVAKSKEALAKFEADKDD